MNQWTDEEIETIEKANEKFNALPDGDRDYATAFIRHQRGAISGAEFLEACKALLAE